MFYQRCSPPFCDLIDDIYLSLSNYIVKAVTLQSKLKGWPINKTNFMDIG